jgi:hypothetical protein
MEPNKEIQVLKNKIFCIEDFLFSDTCELLVSTFSGERLIESDRKGIFGSPGTAKGDDVKFEINGFEKTSTKNDNKDINIGIDILTSLLTNIEKTSSKLFNKNLVLKSYFYSHMKKGSKNTLHVDNYNEQYSKDYSVLLYLTNSYSGGNLVFPEQDLSLKPKPGTFIAFIGTEDLKHEVEEVIDGDRVNIICFLSEKEEQ